MAGSSSTVWFGMKVTPEQKRRIKQLAARRQTSAKKTLLDLVNQALQDAEVRVEPGSVLEGLEHLAGSVEGPEDLSTNPRHMDGFGR